MWVQRKSSSYFNAKGGTTDNPKVLCRSELYMPTVNGVPVGPTWDVDIDGCEYKKRNAPLK